MGEELNRDDKKHWVLEQEAIEALRQRIVSAIDYSDENLTDLEKDIMYSQQLLNESATRYIFTHPTLLNREEFIVYLEQEYEKMKQLIVPHARSDISADIRDYFKQMKEGGIPDYVIYLQECSGLDLSTNDFPKQYAKKYEALNEAYLQAVARGERKSNLGHIIEAQEASAQMSAFHKGVQVLALHEHGKWLVQCFDAVHKELPKPQVQGLGALVEEIVVPPTSLVSKPFVRELGSLKRGDAPVPQADTAFYRDMQAWRKEIVAAICAEIVRKPTLTEDRLDEVLLDARVQAMSQLSALVEKETVSEILEMEKETALKSPFALFLREQGVLGISGQRLDMEIYIRQHDALQEKFKYWLIVNPGEEEGAEHNPENAVFKMPADERYQFYCKQFDCYCKMADIEAVAEHVQAKFVAYEKLVNNAGTPPRK